MRRSIKKEEEEANTMIGEDTEGPGVRSQKPWNTTRASGREVADTDEHTDLALGQTAVPAEQLRDARVFDHLKMKRALPREQRAAGRRKRTLHEVGTILSTAGAVARAIG